MMEIFWEIFFFFISTPKNVKELSSQTFLVYLKVQNNAIKNFCRMVFATQKILTLFLFNDSTKQGI